MSSSNALRNFSSPKVDYVQIDSIVAMKIAKHVDIEYNAGLSDIVGETCHGILTGLISVDEKRLEVTNCFPTPRLEVQLEGEEADAAAMQEDKQTEIIDTLKRFRNMNIDYELVGFYQSHMFGACFDQDVIEDLNDYQISNPDAVVLIYDPVRTRSGLLSLKAYRLSKKAFEICTNGNWSSDVLKKSGLSASKLMEELPIVIKSSHLMNVLFAELRLSQKFEPLHLELGTHRALEKSMRSLLLNVDELNKGLATYNKYIQDKQKYDTQLNSLIQKRQAENETRQARGEPPLPFDDIKKALKMPQLQIKSGMMDLYLRLLESKALTDFQSSVACENISKLFVSKAASDTGTAATLP